MTACLLQQGVQSFFAHDWGINVIQLHVCTRWEWHSGVISLCSKANCSQDALFQSGVCLLVQCGFERWQLASDHTGQCDLTSLDIACGSRTKIVSLQFCLTTWRMCTYAAVSLCQRKTLTACLQSAGWRIFCMTTEIRNQTVIPFPAFKKKHSAKAITARLSL